MIILQPGRVGWSSAMAQRILEDKNFNEGQRYHKRHSYVFFITKSLDYPLGSALDTYCKLFSQVQSQYYSETSFD